MIQCNCVIVFCIFCSLLLQCVFTFVIDVVRFLVHVIAGICHWCNQEICHCYGRGDFFLTHHHPS